MPPADAGTTDAGTADTMITTKAQVVRVLKNTCKESNFTPDRDQQWSMFCHVCDNLLNDGRITTEQHIRWTHVF